MRRLLLISLGLLLVGCGSSPGGSSNRSDARAPAQSAGKGPHVGGRIIIGVQQEPEILSEILNAMVTNDMVCNLIFSKFVKYDDHFNLIPDLITEIPTVENGGISPDYLTYTYHMRPDAYWHDGKPVTSHDAEFTYEVIMHPDVNAESREGWDVVDKVETPDDHTIVFHLKQPYPDFVDETFLDESVLPEHLLRKDLGKRFHSSPFLRAPIGSGPFKFKEWVPGSHLTVVRNDHYYGKGPYLDEIIFKFVPNENALLVQLQTGEIDIFDNANINFMSQLDQIPGIKVYKTPSLMYEHLDLNTQNDILHDKRVRQAIGCAINKQEIADHVYNGMVDVALLDAFPGSKYYNTEAAERAKYDPVRARRLLREAGWKDTDGDGILDKDGRPLRLRITASAGQVNRERTELVLREHLRQVGIDLEVQNYSPTLLYGTYEDGGILKRGKYDIAMYAWMSSPEPATEEALYSSKNIPPEGQNHPRIDDPELTELLRRGSTETDPVKRVAIYKKVQDILVDDMPVVPLFWYTNIDPCTTRLHNFRPNPTQSADTWNAAEWYLGAPTS